MKRGTRSRLLLVLTSTMLCGLIQVLSIVNSDCLAQVTPPITSSGLNTQVSASVTLPSGQTQFNITGGTRPGGGTNLFHSFGNFNVPNNNIANFLNDSGLATSNILGRVTGGNISNIFGTIQTTGFGNANLFLMNPAGFLFGPNATVNVGGMVAFTSADYLRLADGVRFNVTPNATADALLTPSPVAAFGFLGSNPGAITVQGSQFTVTEGTGISLVGGNITIQSGTLDNGTVQRAQLSAPNGTIQLASAASPGEFDAATLHALPNVNGASFSSFGSVSLAPDSTINVSGINTVSIRGGQFVLSVNDAALSTSPTAAQPETISLRPGSSIVTSNSGTDLGAGVQLIASNIYLDGTAIQSLTTGDRPGGNISITGQSISLTNGAQIVSSTDGRGAGGGIDIAATEALSITGFDTTGTSSGIVDPNSGLVRSGIYSTTSSKGEGGGVLLSSPTLTIQEGALLSSLTSGTGQGGDISIVETEAVRLESGGQITSVTGAAGQGGAITVAATDSLLISGLSLDTFSISGIVSQTTASGKGGSISVSSPNVTLQDMGQIRSLTTSTLSDDAGAGGSITIATPGTLSVSGFSDDLGIASGIFSTGELGKSGSVSITGGSVNVSDRALIFTSQNLHGSSGNITVGAGNFSLTGGAEIRTVSGSSGSPSTGTIKITASETASISGQFDPSTPSRISNESASVSGSNGGIVIQANHFILSEGANVLSNTAAPQGGTVTISAANSITMASGAEMVNRRGSLQSGSFNLSASSITMDHAVIRSRTFGDHNAGIITLNATGGNLTLSNDSHVLTSTQGGSGTAGPIAASASDSILMSGGSTIESSSENIATGKGGSITMTANNAVSLSEAGTGLFSLTTTQGAGGNIGVNANTVSLQNGATMSASSTGKIEHPGNAGSINITATNGFSMQNSTITTQAEKGAGGGDIKITTSPEAMVYLQDSTISASVAHGPGGGGNISIDPQYVILQNSKILAQAAQGQGGAISITANLFLSDANSIVNADSGSGFNGTVTIQSPNAPASGKIIPLSQNPLLATSLLSQRCAALARGELSSLTVAGRDSLPAEPGSWLSSPLALTPPYSVTALTEGGTRTSLNNPEGETPFLSLRQIAPPGFLTRTFAVDTSAGCSS